MTRFRKLLPSVFVAGACVICCAQAVHPAPERTSLPLAAGRVIGAVVCQSDPAQSYALYVPSNYTATRGWPIVYAFDPGAHGELPVELYKDIAEKYGFVIAGSNNSRNFSQFRVSMNRV